MQIQHQKNKYFVTHAPLQFHELPREVQSKVLKHTHARFEVTHHKEVEPLWLNTAANSNRVWLQFFQWRLRFVPVVMRYEFNLQRLLADGHQTTARFSR